MAGPAGCSDRVGDSVRGKRGEQTWQNEDDAWIGVNGGGESSSDVNMWSRQSLKRSSGCLVRPVGLGAENRAPATVALASLMLQIYVLLIHHISRGEWIFFSMNFNMLEATSTRFLVASRSCAMYYCTVVLLSY